MTDPLRSQPGADVPAPLEVVAAAAWIGFFRLPLDAVPARRYLCGMTNIQHRILSVQQAAERIGCTRQNVLYLLAKKKLDGWQVNGKCWVVRAASVEAYRRIR